MPIEQIEPFQIIGIQIETTNENNQAEADLGRLWGKLYPDDISSKIPNKSSVDTYAVYTDYESNYQGRYSVIIGHKVHSLQDVPDGMVGKQIDGGKYQEFIAKGEMPQAVVDVWKEVWKKDAQLKRAYTADFEVYSEKSTQGAESEVDIYIATQK